MKLHNNKILITGGGSGIGLGLAERFVQEDNIVIICGRRESVLRAVQEKHPSIIIRQCDLTNEDERINLHQWIAQNHDDLNVLVNNAGIQHWMEITDDDFFQNAKAEIATNIEGPIHLTSLFVDLPCIDTIINVTSGLSFVPMIKVPIYSATKAFFHSYTLSLRALLRNRNIEVIEMIPPAINTDLGGVGIHDFAPPVSDFIDAIFEQLKEGKIELTYGFSAEMAKSDPDSLLNSFHRMNNITSPEDFLPPVVI